MNDKALEPLAWIKYVKNVSGAELMLFAGEHEFGAIPLYGKESLTAYRTEDRGLALTNAEISERTYHDKAMEQARVTASEWVYQVHSWRGRSPEFMQTQVSRLAERMAAYRSEGEQAAERETFETCVRKACRMCEVLLPVELNNESIWIHPNRGVNGRTCRAHRIRAAFPHLAPGKESIK